MDTLTIEQLCANVSVAKTFNERVLAEAYVHNACHVGMTLEDSIAHIKYCLYQSRWSSAHRGKTSAVAVKQDWDENIQAMSHFSDAWLNGLGDASDLPAARTVLGMMICGFRLNLICALTGVDTSLTKQFLVRSWENHFWDEWGRFIFDGDDDISFVLYTLALQGHIQKVNR